MAFNFVAIHGAIKTAITAAGFEYVPVHDWGNFDSGIFPESLNDRGYTIMLSTMEESEFEQTDRNLLQVTVEFILETAKDLYLATLDNAVAAIGTLTGISGATLCNVNEQGLRNFANQFLPKDIGLGKVVVQFSNIQIEIEEA